MKLRSYFNIVPSIVLFGLVIWLFFVIVTSHAHKGAHVKPIEKSRGEAVATETVIADVEDVPIYPHAEQVEVLPSDESSLWRRITTYSALSPIEPVITFYKQALQDRGWILTGEQESSSQVGLSFSWPSDPEDSPLKLDLSIEMTEVQSGTEKRTLLYLWIERTPNILNIPLYPQSEQVEAAMIEGNDGAREREISFTTQAAPVDVRAYYETRMVQYGWGSTNAESQDDLSFWYSRGNPESWRAGRVFIEIVPLAEGKTRVRIRARGTEIDLLQDQQR